ncbi:hypothetical protein Q7Y31_05880 [Glaesserella parasuis]|nr:hypothetical protein [Glaesserella parasuis]
MNRGITFTPPQNDHINMQKTAIQHQIEKLLEPIDAIERMQINAEKHFELKNGSLRLSKTSLMLLNKTARQHKKATS